MLKASTPGSPCHPESRPQNLLSSSSAGNAPHQGNRVDQQASPRASKGSLIPKNQRPAGVLGPDTLQATSNWTGSLKPHHSPGGSHKALVRKLKFKVLPEHTASRCLSQNSHVRPSGLENLVFASVQHNEQGLGGGHRNLEEKQETVSFCIAGLPPAPEPEYQHNHFFFVIQWVGNSGIRGWKSHFQHGFFT